VNSNYLYAKELTENLNIEVRSKKSSFYLAISGGTGASILFKLWSGMYQNIIPWENIDFFWVDERCVPPDHIESNYGNAVRDFFSKVDINPNRIHRIYGENDNRKEAVRYSEEVCNIVPKYNLLPKFDMIILGIGDDGHTASIFPGQTHLLSCMDPYAPSVNPYDGVKRVTMTAPLILNSEKAVFYLYGEAKSLIMEKILNFSGNECIYPASYLLTRRADIKIFWDR